MAQYIYEKWSLKSEWSGRCTGGYADAQTATITSSQTFYTDYETYNQCSSVRLKGSTVTITSTDLAGQHYNTPALYRSASGNKVVKCSRFLLKSGYVEYQTEVITFRQNMQNVKDKLLEILVAEEGTYPNDGIKNDYWYVKKELANTTPTVDITLPTANQTLHENSTFTLTGNTTDVDIDDVVTIKYQIDSGAVRNLASAVSDGATPIDFTKALTYKDGVLKDGNTAVTSVLDKDVPHTVSMWAEDNNGGKSAIVTRTFFVVPNRPPSITVNPIATQSDLINSNIMNISGAVTDLDNNDVTVTFKINDGEEQQVYQGPPSAFTFNILLNDLKVGANTVILKARDIYNTSGTKTLTINKTHNATPVNTAVARYQIQAPTGSAKSILLWVTRTLGNLGMTAEVSLTNGTEAENYVALTQTNDAVVNGEREIEYAYQDTVEKEKIILKITYNRTDAAVIDTIKQISGVLF